MALSGQAAKSEWPNIEILALSF